MSKLGMIETVIATKLVEAVKKDESEGGHDIANGIIGVEVSKLIKELASEISDKQVISGSKYNYTEQVGDNLISYGLDTYKELSDCIIGIRKRNATSK